MQGFDDLASNASSRRSRASAVGADAANSSKQLTFPEPDATKMLTRYFPMFPIMMTYKQANMQVVSLIGMLIFFMQQVAFVLNPHFGWAWGTPLGSDLATAFYIFQFPFYDPALTGKASTIAFIVLAYVLLAVTIALIGCILFHLRRTEDKAEGKGPTSFVAKTLLEVLSTVLLVPIFQLCFAGMICGSTGHMWMLSGVTNAKCWGGMHIATFVASLLSLLALLPMLYIKLACVYDYRPVSDNFLACRYSILYKVSYVHDVFACFLFNIMIAWNVGVGFAILLAVSSFCMAVAYIHYLPYFSMNVNRFHVCVRAVQCVASIFLTCSLMRYSFLESQAAAPMFLGCGLIFVVMMVVFTDYRVNPKYLYAMKRTAQCSVAQEESNSDEDDVHGADHDDDDDDDVPIFEASDEEVDALPYPGGLVRTNAFSQYVGLNKQIIESITRQELNVLIGGGGASKKKKLIPVLEPYVNELYNNRDVILSIGFLDLFSRQFGVDQVHEIMLLFATNIFSKALTSFPDEPEVIQGFASYIIHYLPGLSFMGVELVKRMLRMPTTVDQQFRAVKQANELRLALGIRTHVHSILSTKARMSHARVLQSINKYWVKLTEPSVNIEEVSDVADDIKAKREVAVSQFDIALRHQQHADPLLLRRLGDFFAEVLMAPDAAQECYNESRDIYEARQARSMRGTRQHTAEVDVVALTERQRYLLHQHSRSNSSSSAHSSTGLMRKFAVVLTVLFIFLILCSCLMLVISGNLTSGLQVLLERTVAISQLRIAASRFGSLLLGSLLPGGASASDSRELMGELANSFATNFQYVTSGKGRPASAEGKYLLEETSIPFYDPIMGDQYGTSLWALSEEFLQAMGRFLNTSMATSASGESDTEVFLMHAGVMVSDAYGDLLDLSTTEDMSSVATQWITWLISVFAVALIVLVATYVALLFALRHTALTRVFTFQLFTLIPYDALERLATEAKERYHQIHLEKSFRRQPKTDSGDAHVAVGEVERDVKEVATKTDTKYTGGYDGTLTQIKSCMKQKPEPKGERSSQGSQKPAPPKQVTFNPVVEVVGGTDKKQDDKKKKDEADEDDDLNLLLMSGMNRKKERVKTTTNADESRKDLYSTILYLFLILACIAVSFTMLGLSLNYQIQYNRHISEYAENRGRVIKLGMSFPVVFNHMLQFIRSGSIVEFQSSQNMNSEIIQGLPDLMGMSYPTESISKLAEMHKISQQFGNVTLDVAALAAKPLGISLAYWADLRARNAMDEADLTEYLSRKYNMPKELTDDLRSHLSLPVEYETTAFCYRILVESYLNSTANYRALFYSVMEDITRRESETSVIPSGYVITLLVAAATGTALSLVVGLTPLQHFIAKYLSFHHTMTLLLTFLILLGFAIWLFVANNSVVQGNKHFHDSVMVLNDFIEMFIMTSNRLTAFVLGLRAEYWFQGVERDRASSTDLLAGIVIEKGLDLSTVDLFHVVGVQTAEAADLNNISSALAISALDTFPEIEMEEPMREALNNAFWDITVESWYRPYLNGHPPGTYYTTKVDDLQEPIGTQYTIAVNIITSTEYAEKQTAVFGALEQMYLAFTSRTTGSTGSKLSQRMTVTIITLAICVLPLAACLWMGSSAAIALLRVLHLTDSGENQNNSEDGNRYRSMLARTKYSLLFLLVLFSGSFGVGVWLTQTGYVYTEQLRVAAEHQSDSSVSIYLYRQLLSPLVAFVTPDLIQTEIRSMSDRLALQFSGISKTGVSVGLYLSQELNVMMFGPTNLDDQLPVINSFLMSNCSRYLSGNTAPMHLLPSPDYAGLTEPIAEGMLDWVTLMTRAIIHARDFSDGGGAALEQYSSTLSEDILTLVPALMDSNYIVIKAVQTNNKNNTSIFLGLSVVTLIASIAVYVAIIIPTIVRLFREEESLRMLLQMIPPDVRDEVPAITQHMETGHITNASELQQKFEANEKLLQNILPQKIATRLKSGEQPIADNHECVTMLFTDFVGFTKRSSNMQAREIVDFLNEVFLEFDTIVELLNLEKIKTIGDAFFMAGGLDAQVADHALRVVEAGLQFFEALDEHNRRHPSRQPLQMRLGIHSGPVVAGVIGIKKVAYDLWGDSVDIANAMESTGVPGYVHISEDTAKYVRGFFRLQPRGELPREKEHVPDNMPPTFLVVGRELPTPYMHIRRPRMIPTNFREKNQNKEK